MDQQRARATRGVVDIDFFTAGEMPGHYFAHELRNFARRVELTGLLTRIGSEVANQILIDEAEGVVVLPAVHRNVLDEVDEVASGLATAFLIGTEFG